MTTSHFVAPRAYADSFTTGGVRLKASRDMLAVKGIIIMLRTTLAVRMSIPIGVPSKRMPRPGTLPRVACSAGSMWSAMMGASVKRPHMP